MPSPVTIARARVVLPISRPPIEDGAVTLSGERIVGVSRWSEVPVADRENVVDLGEAILLPGLINAHCHLDYTDMVGQIPPPRMFSDWIKAIVALKGAWSYADFAQSWLRGARMLLRTGTTTVADVEAVPELIPEMWNATPLRVISFRELISLKSRFAVGELVDTAAREWAALPSGGTSPPSTHSAESLGTSLEPRHISRVGLSPHAPYSTTAELLQLAARTARKHHWRLTTHVAESEQEFEMFMYGQGQLHDWLQSQRDMSDCGRGSPVQHLERCGYLSEDLLAVHTNYLWRDDAALLATRKVSVVHCPHSHAYFRHLLFPYAELAAAGINVCLGTDSLASTLSSRREHPELNLFSEMQAFATQRPEVSPAMILRMATINGAAALGQSGAVGELSPNALADLIVLPFAGKLKEAEAAAVHHDGNVAAAMINGHWVVRPSGPGVNSGGERTS